MRSGLINGVNLGVHLFLQNLSRLKIISQNSFVVTAIAGNSFRMHTLLPVSERCDELCFINVVIKRYLKNTTE